MKNRFAVILLLFSITFPNCFAERTSLDSLDYYISRQSEYDRQKEDRIKEIKEKIVANNQDKLSLYSSYLDLFEEYRCYIYDSAYVCVEKLMKIASELNDHDKIVSSKVKLGFCYLSSGLFKEAFDELTPVCVADCSTDTKIDYFTCESRLYYDVGDYNNTPGFRNRYNKIGNGIIDSAIILLPYNSPRYWAAVGLKNMKSDRYEDAAEAFQKMIDSKNYTEHELAIATSSLAYVMTLMKRKAESEEYLIQAAISDIKSSTKETTALRNLAQLLHGKGDIDHAALYIRQALKDASFYNARHRQLEIGSILPIIEGERINIIEKQRDKITVFFISISILLLLLLVALFIIWKSRRRLHFAKQTIQAANNDLMEANKIKDEYIGYFFSQNSEFIEKMKTLQKWVNQKAIARQYDDLKNFPQSIDVRKEREALFERFDQIFLKLFPDFVGEFNKLLKPEEQIHLKKDELLNTDLRIYALIRLGVNDNEKIAQFLDYSVNTVYAYKTKIKSKACIPGEAFKQKIMEIKSI